MQLACCSAHTFPTIKNSQLEHDATPGSAILHVNKEVFEIYLQEAIELTRQKQYADAENLWRLALDQASELNLRDPGLTTMFCSLGTFYRLLGRFEAASGYYQTALALTSMLWGSEHPRVASYLVLLSELYCDQGRIDEAELLYLRARAIENRIAQQTIEPHSRIQH